MVSGLRLEDSDIKYLDAQIFELILVIRNPDIFVGYPDTKLMNFSFIFFLQF